MIRTPIFATDLNSAKYCVSLSREWPVYQSNVFKFRGCELLRKQDLCESTTRT